MKKPARKNGKAEIDGGALIDGLGELERLKKIARRVKAMLEFDGQLQVEDYEGNPELLVGMFQTLRRLLNGLDLERLRALESHISLVGRHVMLARLNGRTS